MGSIKDKLHEVISEAETPQGKLFDVVLLWAILLSVAVVFLESVPEIRSEYEDSLRLAEYSFTAIFTVEYILRLVAAGKALRYAGSFFGVVDLLSILPSFIELLLPGTASLRVIRILRLFRVFRVLKLVSFASEATALMEALKGARKKILVFMSTVLILVTILGTMVYIVESEASGFTSIPRSIYWAIVTVTTVGYGDIVPATVLGQTIASFIMLIGFAIIAVPTGIVSAEMLSANKRKEKSINTHVCKKCSAEGHDDDAVHCNKCGGVL
jgi:voltage-gated potassium channel